MVVVKPAPGEFYLGHYARNWRINNNGETLTPSIARLPHGRVSWSYPNEMLPYPYSHFARSLGFESESYWRAHTLQPLHFLTSFSQEGSTVQWAFSITRLRVGCGYNKEEVVRYCPACVQADEDTFGFAYWRRDHLVPGVDLCFVHDLPLVIFKTEHRATAFIYAPGEESVDLEDTPSGLNETKTNVVVQSYLSLLQRAIHAVSYFPGSFVRFQKRARRALGTGRIAEQVWVDEALERLRYSVPEQWLIRHFPAFTRTAATENRFLNCGMRLQDLPGTALLLLKACTT
ncbi:hypothetical protein BN2905_21970 [Achromobacter xylosoxidans]|uniref:TniQ family protein n=1 Tax=Alcaligenes xylosoxydans xylosoxydans TaxID=85698 RepID=UPI0012A9B02D|nr:hypothetical protein BN2905_21970 [Achromobacter xylosoxidans]